METVLTSCNHAESLRTHWHPWPPFRNFHTVVITWPCPDSRWREKQCICQHCKCLDSAWHKADTREIFDKQWNINDLFAKREEGRRKREWLCIAADFKLWVRIKVSVFWCSSVGRNKHCSEKPEAPGARKVDIWWWLSDLLWKVPLCHNFSLVLFFRPPRTIQTKHEEKGFSRS